MVLTTTKRRPNVGASSQASTSAPTSGPPAASSPASQAAPAVTSHQPRAITPDREIIDQERARASGTASLSTSRATASGTASSSTSRANGPVEPTAATTTTSTWTSTPSGIVPRTPNATRFAPSQQPPSSKALGKRRQNSPDASTLPSPTSLSLSLGTSTSQPPRPDRKGGRKRIKPSRDQTHSINGPKLAPGAGHRSKKKNIVLPEEQASTDGSKPSAMVLRERRKEFLKKVRETKGVEEEEEEEDWSVEKIRSVKTSLLEQIQAELDQIQQEYKTLSDELVKAQIEESVWNNVKKETLAERTHLRYLNKGQLMHLLTNPRPT